MRPQWEGSAKSQKAQGTNCKMAKAHEDRIANVDTPVKLQSDIDVPKASLVERSRFVILHLFLHLVSIIIIFFW